jgi:hypothetical protein
MSRRQQSMVAPELATLVNRITEACKDTRVGSHQIGDEQFVKGRLFIHGISG